MNLGIDVYTKSKGAIISKLKRLKTTKSVVDGGAYWADKNYSQIHIDTDWSEEQLDAWLYRTKGVDYIGVYPLVQTHEGETPCSHI